MKSEMKFKNGQVVVIITDVVRGVSREFGPFTFDEASAIVRNSDVCREMFCHE